MPLRGIIFDLDDTLYLERQFAFSGYDAVVAQFGQSLGWGGRQVERMKSHFDGPNRGRVFDALLEETGVEARRRPSLVREMVRCYREHQPQISLCPDAESALRRFAPKYQLGLLSDGPLQTQRNKVAALGLVSRLRIIVLTDELGAAYWKPHPGGYEMIARSLRLRPEELAYVADNPAKDFFAPNQLGWKSIRIRRPEGVYYNAVGPDHGLPSVTIESLDELDSHVG